MSFEVIKWVYNKTFVKIMKNTVHFRNFENSRLNKSDVKIGEDERFLIGTTVFYFLDYIVLGFKATSLLKRGTSRMNMLKKGRP